MKPYILINFDGAPARRALGEEFTFVDLPPRGPLPEADVRAAARIVVAGQPGLSREQMDLLPALGMIHVWGAGYDKVDLLAAKEKGILVSFDAGTNAVSVADHAIALLFAVARNIPKLSELTKKGNWRRNVPPPMLPTGKRIGIIGIGRIGELIGRRAEAFEMKIAYHTRRPRPDLPWRHYPSAGELAGSVDILVVAAPGGPSTHHMIDGDVLKALGPKGILVNVGRGSIVDTEALVQALETGAIAGAGLDVYEDEPNVPAALSNLENAVLTPHIAGWAPEVHEAAVSVFRQNIDLFLRGKPLLTPVPES